MNTNVILAVILSLLVSETVEDSRKNQDTKIHYPDEVLPIIEISKENCTYKFCEYASNYPSKKIINAIKGSKLLKGYFKNDDVAIFNRFGNDYKVLCPSNKHTIFPKTGKTTDGDEMFIVNVEDYKQGVTVEICNNSGGECDLASSFPNNYKTSCLQKYSTRKLMSIKENSNEPTFSLFEFPSCCVCTYEASK